MSASQVDIFPSPSQIASSLSVEASIGSVVIGLLLVRHMRIKRREAPAGAVSGQSHLACALKYHSGSRCTSTKTVIGSSVLNLWLLFSVFRGLC